MLGRGVVYQAGAVTPFYDSGTIDSNSEALVSVFHYISIPSALGPAIAVILRPAR